MQTKFNLEGKPTQDSTLSDPHLKSIYNSTGNLIPNIANDDDGTGYNSKLTFTATTNDTYCISVGAYSGNTGTYTLTTKVIGNTNTMISNTANNDYIYNAKIIQWTSFNKPKHFAKNNNNDTTTFVYAPNRSRYQKTQTKASSNTTITTTYIGKLYEQIKQNTSTEHKHFIYADGQLIAINIKTDTTADTPSIPDKTRYLHYDNLGSIDTITDGQGNIVERMSYHAFGQRRQGDWRASDPLLPIIPTLTNRGFTGYEHIDEMDFIHMNGRVYDPSIGRFLSADPNIQALYNTQSYNRYSYVLNNPLKYSDPSGFLSERITNAFRYNPYFKAAGAIIAFAYGGPEGVALYSAGLASLSGASDEDVLKAAVGLYIISSAAAGINTSVSNVILRATSYGILGGASSLISDGNFADGFVIGIIGSIANGYMRQTGGLAGRTTIVAISGGVIEELGGGKFINGATSAAFAYLFSESIKPELKVKFSIPGYEANDSVYDSAEEAYNAGAESPTASTRVRKQLIIYSQTAVGNRVMSQRGTLTIYPDYDSKPSAPINKMLINYSGGNILALGHEVGHTTFGGGYVDFKGQGGCSSCPVGNVQVHENSLRRELGIKLRSRYIHSDGRSFNVDGVQEGYW
jgi:RHS repeat-associated protein